MRAPLDISSLLWPDAQTGWQPQALPALRDQYKSAAIAYIGGAPVSSGDALMSEAEGLSLGERMIRPVPSFSSTGRLLGFMGTSFAVVIRIRLPSSPLYWYYYLSDGAAAAVFTPYHSSAAAGRAIFYDGVAARDSGITVPQDRYTTIVMRFTPTTLAWFADGVKTAESSFSPSNTWMEYRAYNLEGTVIPEQSLLVGIQRFVSDDACVALSNNPYRELFAAPVGIWHDYAIAGGAPTLATPTFARVTSSGFGVSVGLS